MFWLLLEIRPPPTFVTFLGASTALSSLCKRLAVPWLLRPPPTFEIFFQPSLNGDKPDIAILEENFGLMIIEVKDWDLRSYRTEKSSFKVIFFNSFISSGV